jgi:hypothetical protein
MAGPRVAADRLEDYAALELTAAVCSATRGWYWPFITTTGRANSTGSQTRPVLSGGIRRSTLR